MLECSYRACHRALVPDPLSTALPGEVGAAHHNNRPLEETPSTSSSVLKHRLDIKKKSNPIMSVASSLPASVVQASQSAIAAARADPATTASGSTIKADELPSPKGSDDLDADGAQELSVDGPSPEDAARTVFEDPVSFNVKVCIVWMFWNLQDFNYGTSTRCTRYGLSGSIRLRQKPRMADLRHRCLRFLRRRLWRRAGWRTSKRSLRLTASRNSGGDVFRSRAGEMETLTICVGLQTVQQHRASVAASAESKLLSLQGLVVFRYCFIVCAEISRAGRNHTCLGRCCKQRWRKMEHPATERQEPCADRQDVALYGK